MSRPLDRIVALSLGLLLGRAAFADPMSDPCGPIVIDPGSGGGVIICADIDCTGGTGTATGGSVTSDNTTTYPGSDLVFSVGYQADGSIGFTFSNPSNLDLSYINAVTSEDLDGDGWPDMILGVNGSATGGAGVQVLMNDATGSGIVVYDATLPTGASAGNGPVSVAAVDVNQDGWPDIVTANGADDSVSVLINNGDGTFAAPVLYATGAYAGGLSSQDLDGDGVPDLLLDTAGTLTVLIANGDGTFAPAASYATGGNFTSITVADVVGDGESDLILYGGSSGVGVLLNHGDGTYGAASWTGVAADQVSFDDFNGDGVPDLAALDTAGGQVTVITGGGDGTFMAPATYAVGTQPYTVWSFDQNGDGWEDIVTDNGDGTQSLLLNDGDGTFAPAQTYVPMPVDVCMFMVPGNIDPGSSVELDFAGGVMTMKGLKHPHQLNGAPVSGGSSGMGGFDLFGLLFLAGLAFLRRRSFTTR
jgi:hypothetical protein